MEYSSFQQSNGMDRKINSEQIFLIESAEHNNNDGLQHKNQEQEVNIENNETKNMMKIGKSITKHQVFSIKKKNLRAKKAEVIGISNRMLSSNILRISPELSITIDGIIKFYYTLSQVSFGSAMNAVENINYQKQSDIVEVNFQILQKVPQITIEEALKFISHTPCKQFLIASETLKEYYKKRRYQRNILDSLTLDNQAIERQEEQLISFVQFCQEYLQEYSLQNEGRMFQFAIGRLNFSKKEGEVVKLGYSKTFLDFIGIDVSDFSSMILRNKEICLMKDENEITEQSLFGLATKLEKGKEIEYTSLITTFDGFPLRIRQVKRQAFPNYVCENLSCLTYEYTLTVTDIDVDLKDIQNLITYRENILFHRKDLSIEEFIKKELSFMFEDVEYSVHSQSFIEKYYEQNLQSLYQLEIQRQSQFNKLHSKHSSFKPVFNAPHLQPIQIIQTISSSNQTN